MMLEMKSFFTLRPRCLCRVARLAVLMALGVSSLTDAQSQEQLKDAKRPDLVGHVRAGDLIPKATIFIFTAGPKVGTSTFCPSCYADCRKSAKSDALGEFKVES